MRTFFLRASLAVYRMASSFRRAWPGDPRKRVSQILTPFLYPDEIIDEAHTCIIVKFLGAPTACSSQLVFVQIPPERNHIGGRLGDFDMSGKSEYISNNLFVFVDNDDGLVSLLVEVRTTVIILCSWAGKGVKVLAAFGSWTGLSRSTIAAWYR